MAGREDAAGGEHAAQFAERAVGIEIEPALVGRRRVERRVGERDRLGGGHLEAAGKTFFGGEPAGGFDLAGGDVDAGHLAALPGELPGEQSGPGRKVEDALAGAANAECGQSPENSSGGPGRWRA